MRPSFLAVTTPIAALMCATVYPARAQATTFYERPFLETVEDAPVIVRGNIGTSYGNWGFGADGTKRIYTFFEMRVEEVLKGDASAGNLVIRELGGEKDSIGMQVAGSANFERGEDVVVFLNPKNPDGSFDIRGMMMGKFNIEKDSSGEEYLVGPGLGGAHGESHILREHEHTKGHDDPKNGPKNGMETGPKNSKWTIKRLRQLIKEQTPDSMENQNERQNPGDSGPIAKPITKNDARKDTAHSPPLQAPRNAAPQLQHQQTEEREAGKSPDAGIFVAAALGFAIIAGVVWRSTSRRRK